jgi:DNA polymerase epsilon subunit 1
LYVMVLACKLLTHFFNVNRRFLDGNSLEECFASAAEIANHWIDIIDTRGESLEDDDLIGLISENRNMSRQLDDYGDQKGTSQTTARRLGEFLGMEIIKDKGLNCQFIIAEQPYGAPVTERAIPVAIWRSDPAVMTHYLRKWLKFPGAEGDALDIRNVLDWDYYLCRLAKTIQKIITIPAALQKVSNPVPRIPHPAWLDTKVNQLTDRFKQRQITSMFSKKIESDKNQTQRGAADIEDIGASDSNFKRPMVHSRRRRGDTPAVGDKNVTVERVRLSKENFAAWLTSKKTTWRRDRRERKFAARLGERGEADKRPRTAVTSIEGFVRDAARSLSQNEWHIVEIRGASNMDGVGEWSMSNSGDFTVWVMVGGNSLQKIRISVPRTVYISTHKEIGNSFDGLISFKKVEKHLPHSKSAPFVYELVMPEHVYRTKNWMAGLRPVDAIHDAKSAVFETVYESGVPLLSSILSKLGCVSRLNPSAAGSMGVKAYSLADLARVDRPLEGEYLNSSILYKRLFLYVRINPKMKTGVVAVYIVGDETNHVDRTRPSQAEAGTFDIGASCHVWIVKPGSSKGQRNVSVKQCEKMFKQLLGTVQEAASLESEYSSVSPFSEVKVSSLSFVDDEKIAFAGANATVSSNLKQSNGPTFILLNSNCSQMHLRRFMSTVGSLPVIPLPFPPGPAHNPNVSTLPALGWEQPAVQLGLEAYLFAMVISYPKRVSYSRYGHVPLGNLSQDENVTLYDVCLSRTIQKNRALSWASITPGRPDLGVNFLPSAGGGTFPLVDTSAYLYSQEEIWGDDDELISPVIRRPGTYRSVCVDIDLQDLAIAALTDAATSISPAMMVSSGAESRDPNSPTSVMNDSFNLSKISTASPLGDEMSTSISLPIVRALVSGWLKDAFATNSLVADELLHYIYRLVSDQDSLLHDPALHRAVHRLMKLTFLRLLGELQRLGCSIVYASFQKVTVATGKLHLAEAEEYVEFVVSTIRRRASENSGRGDDALARISLRPRLFHTHFVFLDEFNFGTMQLDRVGSTEVVEPDKFFIKEDGNDETAVVPTVVTAWSLMNYLGSEIAQEYFRAIIGRFSRDVLKKQMTLDMDESALSLVGTNSKAEQLLKYRQMVISEHFAAYLTRAVDEMLKDGDDDRIDPPLGGELLTSSLPALEFIKNVVAVLELDSDVEKEVHGLKRSLLAQVGVAEYAKTAQWKNPCPRFVLPDVFCAECHESRDVNLCYIPPRSPEEDYEKTWACDDCGTAYDVNAIERRLVSLVHCKVARYALQDVRCVKTNRVATRSLAPLSDCSAGLKLDIPLSEAEAEIKLLHNLAEFHDLETLVATTDGLLRSFRIP